MGVIKLSHGTDITPLDNSAKIQFIHPVCKAEKGLQFPKSDITQANGLSTMLIARGLVYDYQFTINKKKRIYLINLKRFLKRITETMQIIPITI